jgi:hypothetical protein
MLLSRLATQQLACFLVSISGEHPKPRAGVVMPAAGPSFSWMQSKAKTGWRARIVPTLPLGDGFCGEWQFENVAITRVVGALAAVYAQRSLRGGVGCFCC